MRLVCPNCDAEYEVDDAAIPRSGRDVQCSNCGHAWFQFHPEAEPAAYEAFPEQEIAEEEGAVEPETQEVAAAGAEDDGLAGLVARVAEAVPEPEPVPAPVAEQPAAGVSAGEASVATRNIDESVLAVLREEAAREVAARKAEKPAPMPETQTEMPLVPAAAAVTSHVVARLKGEPEPQVTRPRRDLLPAIEEINSTLRASSGRVGEDLPPGGAADAQGSGGAFGRGFMTLVLFAVILLALYVFAPLIAEKVPALAGLAGQYVAAVDAARIWLDDEIRALISMLRGIEGTAQG